MKYNETSRVVTDSLSGHSQKGQSHLLKNALFRLGIVFQKKIQTGAVIQDWRTFLWKNLGMYKFVALRLEIAEKKIVRARKFGAIALSYPP